MSNGTVKSDRTIVIPLSLRDKAGDLVFVDAVMDTGFDGELTLPNRLLDSLQAEELNVLRVELADGSFVRLKSYEVEVEWMEETRNIMVLEADSVPLLGMSLLWNSRVTFDAVDGGAVSVVPLKS